MDAYKKHDVTVKLKRLASDIGRTPKRDDLFSCEYLTRHAVTQAFGTFSRAIEACGFFAERAREVPKKFAYRQMKLDSVTVHEAPLSEWFSRAGNPPSLKVIAQPDTHVKYMDEQAVSVFLKFMQYYSPHVTIIMGDFLDAEGLSHWENNSTEAKRIVPEVIRARELLQAIERSSPKAVARIYLTGNHEDWIAQAFAARLPELFDGLDELGLMPDLKGLLDLDSFGYQLIPVNHLFRLGHAYFTHGLYTGENHAKKHLSVIKKNIYYGHVHDARSYTEFSIDGPIEAHSLGCLCRLDAKFLKGKPNNWVHAFGIFEFFPDGTYTFMCPKIIKGRLSICGTVFTAN